MDTRLRADHILAYRGGDHVWLHDGEVIVRDDRILSVGPRTDGEVDQTIELGTSLLMPGLIDLDALADIDHAIFDSCWGTEHSAGLSWSEDYFRNRRADVFDRADKAFIRWYAFYQLLLHGVTTAMPIAAETHSGWAETYADAIDMAAAATDLGLRAYIGPSYRSGVNVELDDGSSGVLWDETEGDRGLADAIRFVEWTKEFGGDLVNGVLLPCRIETLTEELMRATADAAGRLDVLVRLHCLQGSGERVKLDARYGTTPVELLARTGLLNDHLLIPHGIYVDSSSYVGAGTSHDVTSIAAAGASIVHCPLTSIRYGSALESFARYRDAGITIALGTDSFPPDLVRGMDIGVNVAKIIDSRLDAASAADYVRAATLNGATALHRDDLGRVAAGAMADLVAFPLDDVHDGVIEDPVRTLLYNSNARQTRLSMVAGRIVVRDGAVPGVDVDAVRARAQALFDRMQAAYSDRDRQRRTTAELFPPSFPSWD